MVTRVCKGMRMGDWDKWGLSVIKAYIGVGIGRQDQPRYSIKPPRACAGGSVSACI